MTPELASAIAAAISASAAVVTLIVAGAALYIQHRAAQPRAKVTASPGLPAYGDRLGQPWYGITIYNAGSVAVRVGGAGFQTANGGTVPFLGAAYGHPRA